MDQVLKARPVLLAGMLFGDSIVFKLEQGRDVDQRVVDVVVCWSCRVLDATMQQNLEGAAIVTYLTIATATRRNAPHKSSGWCGCSRWHSESITRAVAGVNHWLVTAKKRSNRAAVPELRLRPTPCAMGAASLGSKTFPGMARLWLAPSESTSSLAVSVAVLIAVHWSCVLAVFA